LDLIEKHPRKHRKSAELLPDKRAEVEKIVVPIFVVPYMDLIVNQGESDLATTILLEMIL